MTERPAPYALTAEQVAVLDALRDLWALRGYSPTFAEIAVRLGWPVTQRPKVGRVLRQLRARGQALGTDGVARTWRVKGEKRC